MVLAIVFVKMLTNQARNDNHSHVDQGFDHVAFLGDLRQFFSGLSPQFFSFHCYFLLLKAMIFYS